MKWDKKDNTKEYEKALMRSAYLPQDAYVLDLFCGKGSMYKLAYENNVKAYKGTDIEKVHNNELCEICDNLRYVKERDISEFNVFDLDAYGSPWKLFYLILRKIQPGEYVFFITDGLVQKQKMGGQVTKFLSGTERIPKGFNIPGLNRFYVDVFLTMLKDAKKRYGLVVNKAAYFHNDRRSVYYWALKIKKS